MPPTRRQLLLGSAGLTGLAGFGYASRVLLPPQPSLSIAPVEDLATALYQSLADRDAADAFVDYDDPFRQHHNRGVPTAGANLFHLRRPEKALLVDLVHASLSPTGRGQLPEQLFLGLIGFQYGRILFCGSPLAPPYQVLVTSAHLNLRIGGRNREGVAFGGPQVYGDQTGNHELGLPGNTYQDQLVLGQQLIANLTPSQQAKARCAKAPVQTGIEIQGSRGRFQGVSVAELSPDNREQVRGLLGNILGTYAEPDALYAWECIEAGGGVEAFHLADYDQDHQGGRRAGSGPSQIIRLESPGAVFHYRGEPHLHAFINVAMDAENPLSVGEVVATKAPPLEGSDVSALLEDVLREESAEPHAYYPTRAVGGRLRGGTIRTGDLYNLESWDNDIAIIEVERSDLEGSTVTEIERRNPATRGQTQMRLAVPSGVAAYGGEYGIAKRSRVRSLGRRLRPALLAYVQERGLNPSSSG